MDQDAIDPGAADLAATAFDRLRREVTTLRLAVEQLADTPNKIEIPDYTETLGRMANAIGRAAEGLKTLQTSPALKLTPDELARHVAHAGTEARKIEQAELSLASQALSNTAIELRGWIDTARLASVQNLRLLQVGGAAFLGGILLWSMLPGVVARAVPQNWYWPERIAARTLRADLWQAGQQMMAAADRRRLDAIALAVNQPKCSGQAIKKRSK